MIDPKQMGNTYNTDTYKKAPATQKKSRRIQPGPTLPAIAPL